MRRIVLITGGCSGIGKATALTLNKAGFKVYAAARHPDKLDELKQNNVSFMTLDVTEEDSMKRCVDDILRIEGRIDILINNAGYGSYGPVEEVPIEEAKRQFDVNLFGMARMTQLVLPSMRKNKKGWIVNISSMGGKIYTPFGAWYHATKFAVEGFTDCLRLELEKKFHIRVILIEPGGIKTNWGIIAANHLLETSKDTPYEAAATKVADGMRRIYSGNELSNPSLIAETICKALTARKPKTRYLIGYMAKPLIRMRNFLSDRSFDKLMRKTYKI